MNERIDKLTPGAEEQLMRDLLGIMQRVRADLDMPALAATLQDAHEAKPLSDHELAMIEAALGLNGGTLENLLDAKAREESTYLEDGIGSFFFAIVALAAAAVGHSANASDPAMKGKRDEIVRTFRARFFADSATAIRETITRLVAAQATLESRALHLRRIIGTSPAQAAALTMMRETFASYLNAPKNVVPASVVDGRRVTEPSAILSGSAGAARRGCRVKDRTP